MIAIQFKNDSTWKRAHEDESSQAGRPAAQEGYNLCFMRSSH